MSNHSYSWLLVRVTQCPYKPELIQKIRDSISNGEIHVNVCNEEGMTPLMDAAVYDQDTLFHLFLRYGANPHSLTSRDKSAMYYALHHRSDYPLQQQRIVSTLIQHHQKIDQTDWENAISHCDAAIIRTIFTYLPDQERRKIDREKSLKLVFTRCDHLLLAELLCGLYRDECVPHKLFSQLKSQTTWISEQYPHLFQNCCDVITQHNTLWQHKRDELTHLLLTNVSDLPSDILNIVIDFEMGKWFE